MVDTHLSELYDLEYLGTLLDDHTGVVTHYKWYQRVLSGLVYSYE
jgi:hypothetical protein